MFDNKTGLLIDEHGITDNSSAVPAGFIPWDDIKEIGEFQMKSNKMVLIYLHDNEKYTVSRSGWKRYLAKRNISQCGTPISISHHTLQISYTELKQKIEAAFELYKK